MELLKNFKPDVICLDIMMPQHSGIYMLEVLKQDIDFKDIPIVIVTAKTESKDLEECLNKGAVDYVKKPIDDIELLARVRSAIRLKEKEDLLKKKIVQDSNFIKIISHDLRSPISGMMTLIDYTKEEYFEDIPEGVKEVMEYSYKTCFNLIKYLEKLLKLIYMDAKDVKIEKRDNKLIDMVKYVYKLNQEELNNKNINFNWSNNIEEEVVKCDRVLFEQLLNNLIGNAIKFTKKNGSVKVLVETEDAKKVLKIIDNGIGIENNRDIFGGEMEMTISVGTNGEKGTGLGLKIVKKIADIHGFEIGYKSEVNVGTTMNVYYDKGL